MTIILISTKTLIKKKKRESWGERIVSKLSGIYLELFKCIWKWSYPVQKKILQFQVKNEWLVYYNTCPNFNPNRTVSSNLKKARNNKLLWISHNKGDTGWKKPPWLQPKKNPYSIEFCFTLTRNTEGNLNKN